jgi:CO dehydrogenase maturation factor
MQFFCIYNFMKIAFVGKGGSGKTTLSALVARILAARKFPTLAIDADINQHLARTLGMDVSEANKIPAMGLEIVRIKEYLRGDNPRIVDTDSMIKTTPPGHGSRFIRIGEKNPIFDHFVKKIGGIDVMAVGPFTEEDLGIRCYHSKTGAVELILNHLLDGTKEYCLVDMTAGADSFASGLFTRFDITFLVVEPTVKSVSVYEQYKDYARNHAVVIKVIGNKIESEEDSAFLQKHIGNDLIATFSNSKFVKETDRGNHQSLENLEKENLAAIEKIIAVIDGQSKDWQKFYKQAVEFHIKNAKSWANEASGKNLENQIDPIFSYEMVM